MKIRKNSYELARKEAEKEEEPIMEIVAKAIENYTNARKDLEERVRLVIKVLDEEKERNQASSV